MGWGGDEGEVEGWTEPDSAVPQSHAAHSTLHPLFPISMTPISWMVQQARIPLTLVFSTQKPGGK